MYSNCNVTALIRTMNSVALVAAYRFGNPLAAAASIPKDSAADVRHQVHASPWNLVASMYLHALLCHQDDTCCSYI